MHRVVLTRKVATMTRITFSLTADFAMSVNNATTSYFLSRPSAASFSNDSCQIHEMAPYCCCGDGFSLSHLMRLECQRIARGATHPEMQSPCFHTAERNCFLPSTALRTCVEMSRDWRCEPLMNDASDERRVGRSSSGKSFASVLPVSWWLRGQGRLTQSTTRVSADSRGARTPHPCPWSDI